MRLFYGWLAAGLTAAAALAPAGTAQAQELKAITIATSSASIPAAPARLARELGLFEKHGLKATVTPMDSGSVATAGLISGSVDFVTTGPTDVVFAQGRGQKLVALTTGYRGFAATLVISKAIAEKAKVAPNAPIAERLKLLDGLTIGSPSATSTFTIAVKSAAASVGAKVNFVYMAQPAMTAAFQTGAIQGLTVSAPYYVAPVASGAGVIWIAGPKGEFPKASAPANSVVVITRQDYAQANRDVIKRVNAVFAEFWRAVDERPGDIKAAMVRLWPDLDAKTVELVFAGESPAFKAGPLTVAEMAHEIEFLKAGGVTLPQMDKLSAAEMVFVP
jgi:ABC-type nitrate/sulfonate/bicarbonate transport system substrate-binding protein